MAGETKSVMRFHAKGPVGTFAENSITTDTKRRTQHIDVNVIPIDDVIDEDVHLLKIDVQGFEYFVFRGAKKLFTKHVVRNLIFEINSKLCASSGVDFMELLGMVYRDYGMMCFTTRNDYKATDITSFGPHADLAEALFEDVLKDCWSKGCMRKSSWFGIFDDLLCVNTEKAYTGPVLPLL